MRSKLSEMPCRKLSSVCRRERARMPLLRQLEFVSVGQALRLPPPNPATEAVALQSRGGDARLEATAREILSSFGARKLASELRVEWNSRLKTCAGRADYRQKRICLNPKLREHP